MFLAQSKSLLCLSLFITALLLLQKNVIFFSPYSSRRLIHFPADWSMKGKLMIFSRHKYLTTIYCHFQLQQFVHFIQSNKMATERNNFCFILWCYGLHDMCHMLHILPQKYTEVAFSVSADYLSEPHIVDWMFSVQFLRIYSFPK